MSEKDNGEAKTEIGVFQDKTPKRGFRKHEPMLFNSESLASAKKAKQN